MNIDQGNIAEKQDNIWYHGLPNGGASVDWR